MDHITQNQMKQIRIGRTAPAFCLALLLLLSLLVPAFAAEAETAEGADALQAEDAYEVERPDDWETRLLLLLQEKNADPDSIGAGYYNFVTGEEHYYNADQYRVSGSMYKVPLNMLFLDWVADGTITMDQSISGYRYAQLLEGTIIDSNNDYARIMWDYAGATIETNPSSTYYHRYRILIAPTMGEDPDNVDDKYYENNFFTPRQMLTCMKKLYEGREKYAPLIEAMQRAEPEKYFKLRERRFNIAHKYGWYAEDPILYLNDCALCFTDDPIAIVLFTTGTENAYGVVADFCTLMCEYAQEKHAERIEKEEREAAEAEAAAERALLAAEAERALREAQQAIPVSTSGPTAEQKTEQTPLKTRPHTLETGPIIALAVIVIGVLAAIVWFAIRHRRSGMNLRFALLTVLLTASGMIVCFPGISGQSYIAAPKEDALGTVELFFDALKRGDYETADSCLAYGGELGLRTAASDATKAAVRRALEESWDCTLLGKCVTEKANAWQELQLQVLVFSRMESDLQRETRSQLLEFARTRSRDALYDEAGNYRPEVASEAYDLAMVSVLEHAKEYYGSVGVRMELTLTQDGWKIVPSKALFSALCGNLT